jgi:hypothetical protein
MEEYILPLRYVDLNGFAADELLFFIRKFNPNQQDVGWHNLRRILVGLIRRVVDFFPPVLRVMKDSDSGVVFT